MTLRKSDTFNPTLYFRVELNVGFHWMESNFGFKGMFRMNVTDFEFILSQISDLISPQEKFGAEQIQLFVKNNVSQKP